MMSKWLKFFLSKAKNVKKRVWFMLALIMVLVIGWYQIPYKERVYFQAELGYGKAKIERARIYWLGVMSYNKCTNGGLELALKDYLDAISDREAQEEVLYLFNRPCHYVPKEIEEQWKKTIVDYISFHFKNNITQIERWITDNESLEAIIRFYYYRTDYSDNTYWGEQLIEDQIDECEGKERVSCLKNLARIVSKLEYISSERKPAIINLYNLLLKEDLNDKEKDYYQYQKAKYLVEEQKTRYEGMNILKTLANSHYIPAMIYLYRHTDSDYTLNKTQIWNIIGNCYYHSHPDKICEEIKSDILNILYVRMSEQERKDNNIILSKFLEYQCEHNGFGCPRLAELYMDGKLYDKAQDIYQRVFYYNLVRNEIGSPFGFDAAIELGNIYYQGLGLKQDLEQAKKYYGMACDYKSDYWRNNQKACDLYREVNEKLH